MRLLKFMLCAYNSSHYMKAACRKYSCLWIEICVCLFFNRSLVTWVLECLHMLYTCSLTVCPWLPQFRHQRTSNLPLKPVPPTPLVLLCERVRCEVAMVSSVLSSPLSCHVHSCVTWAAQTCPVIAGDGSRFADDKKRAKCTAILSLPI